MTFAVEDSGIGIKKEDIGKLFKIFSKVGSDNNIINPTGIGLGLTICRQIIDNLGGVLEVKSQYG